MLVYIYHFRLNIFLTLIHYVIHRTSYFGEYKNTGPRSDPKGRASVGKQLSEAEVKPFITLGMIQGSKWLLPPPKV